MKLQVFFHIDFNFLKIYGFRMSKVASYIKSIKDKLEGLSAKEREVLFRYNPIHFIDNPTDDEIIRYVNWRDDDMDWPFNRSGEHGDKIRSEVLEFFRVNPPSLEVQEFLLTEFAADCFPKIDFDVNLIETCMKEGRIHFERISRYQTDDLFIVEYNRLKEDSDLRSEHIVESKFYLTEDFVARNFENPTITSKLFVKLMIDKTTDDTIKTYLALKFGL